MSKSYNSTKKLDKKDKYLLLIWSLNSFQKTVFLNAFYVSLTIIFEFIIYDIFFGFLLATISLILSLKVYNKFKDKSLDIVTIEAKRIFWLFILTCFLCVFFMFLFLFKNDLLFYL